MVRQNKPVKQKLYRLSLVENSTHRSLKSIRFTKARAVWSVTAFLILFILFIYCIIAFTPLRRAIPGYPNAHYATYIGAGVNSFVNNTTMKNAVTNIEETPMETIVASQPDYVYILVGTNNLVTQGNEESFLAFYERLIDMLREQLNPGVIFYIQAIPGVQETVVQSKPGLDNARIATVNDLLANLALRKGCYFVNIREVLTNPADGSQIDDYQTSDGVHFTPSGYRAWAEYLATHTVWNRRSLYSGQNPYYIYGA